ERGRVDWKRSTFILHSRQSGIIMLICRLAGFHQKCTDMRLAKLSIAGLFLIQTSAASAQFKSENLFYMVDNAESFESFRKNAAQVSIVSPQVFNMSKEGVLTGSIHPKILEVAGANNVKVMPLIVNTGFNAAILHSVVSSPLYRKRAIEMML